MHARNKNKSQTKKKRFREKANKEVAKQQRILNKEAKKKLDEAWSTKANY
jgi:hypothetical protein